MCQAKELALHPKGGGELLKVVEQRRGAVTSVTLSKIKGRRRSKGDKEWKDVPSGLWLSSVLLWESPQPSQEAQDKPPVLNADISR